MIIVSLITVKIKPTLLLLLLNVNMRWDLTNQRYRLKYPMSWMIKLLEDIDSPLPLYNLPPR